jgi:hypothetical protein
MILALLLLLALAVPASAIPGTPDRIPGASLIVPFFETGINPTDNPHDTLLVVTNWLFADVIIHYHVWDIDGNPTGLNGNVTLGQLDSWSAALRDLINPASGAIKTQLTQGAYYRGFLTIDAVTAATANHPLQGGFPFRNDNALEGFIYYTRLSQGSANGLAMIPLEHVPNTANGLVREFYSGGGSREEIDSSARICANNLALGQTCSVAGDEDGVVDRIHLRHFGSAPLNGRSRMIVFAWNTFATGAGPSELCETNPANCSSGGINYPYKRYDEDGNLMIDSTVRLDHVVNVIDVSATTAGWVSIWDVVNYQNDTQIYAFSFNSANPSGNPNLTWDAIFEGYIIP